MIEGATWELTGRRCAGLTKVLHRFDGKLDHGGGPLEIEWVGGEFTVIDARADWSLALSSAEEDQRRALDDLDGLMRQTVTRP